MMLTTGGHGERQPTGVSITTMSSYIVDKWSLLDIHSQLHWTPLEKFIAQLNHYK